MSFVKAGFWILLILLLLPSNGEERYALYSTVQRTVSDIGGFCNRNPDICDRTSSAFQGVLRKLKSTADMIEDTLHDAGIGAERPRQYQDHSANHQSHSATAALSTSATSSPSTDTLTSDDRDPPWRGPNSR